MAKQYANVQELLGLNPLVADKDNGAYFVESMMDSLEEKAGEFKQTKLTLDAKIEEIKNLNEQIENMKSAHQAEIDKLNSDAETAKSNHEAEVEKLKTDAETAQTQKDEEIKNLKDENESLKAEVEELKKAGTKQPAAGAQEEPGAGKKTDDLTAHSVVTPDMSLAEMRKALEEREALLRNH